MLDHLLRIVFLPGFDGTGELFKDCVGCLPADIEPHVVRYPTDDSRSYSDLVDFLEKDVSGAAPFVIVAESFSVPIAIQYASRNPIGLKGLILCAGFARSPISGFQRSMLQCFGPMLFGIAPPGWMIRIFLVGLGAPRSLVNGVQAALSSVQRHVLVGRLHSVLNCDVRGELTRINVPTLYLRATGDRIVPAACGRDIADANPQCTVLAFKGPHLLLQRSPDQALYAILHFIRGLES